jgi:hypothetical protein
MVFHQAVKSCPDPKPLRVGGLPGAKQAAEKGMLSLLANQEHGSGAKARALFLSRVRHD